MLGHGTVALMLVQSSPATGTEPLKAVSQTNTSKNRNVTNAVLEGLKTHFKAQGDTRQICGNSVLHRMLVESGFGERCSVRVCVCVCQGSRGSNALPLLKGDFPTSASWIFHCCEFTAV